MTLYQNAFATMNYLQLGEGDRTFVWAHGWGQNHQSMLELAQSLGFMGKHYLVDLPGFGQSPKPAEDWTIGDYTAFMAEFIRNLGPQEIVWVGHSFGTRVGIKLAAVYPDLVEKLVLISAAGLIRKRSVWGTIKFHCRVRLFKFMKIFIRSEKQRDKLRRTFGSADYINAGDMRNIFMNTIRENLEQDAAKISCPTLLIYGEKDNETPPEFGKRYAGLIRNAQLRILSDFDHYTILTSAKHQVSQLIRNFIQ